MIPDSLPVSTGAPTNFGHSPDRYRTDLSRTDEDCPSKTAAQREIQERRGWKPLDSWRDVLGAKAKL